MKARVPLTSPDLRALAASQEQKARLYGEMVEHLLLLFEGDSRLAQTLMGHYRQLEQAHLKEAVFWRSILERQLELERETRMQNVVRKLRSKFTPLLLTLCLLTGLGTASQVSAQETEEPPPPIEQTVEAPAADPDGDITVDLGEGVGNDLLESLLEGIYANLLGVAAFTGSGVRMLAGWLRKRLPNLPVSPFFFVLGIQAVVSLLFVIVSAGGGAETFERVWGSGIEVLFSLLGFFTGSTIVGHVVYEGTRLKKTAVSHP